MKDTGKKKSNSVRKGQSDIYIKDIAIKAVLILLACLFIAYFFNTKNPKKSHDFAASIQAGREWSNKDLFAKFNFAVQKTKAEVEKEKNQIQEEIPPYFKLNEGLYDTLAGRIAALKNVVSDNNSRKNSSLIDFSQAALQEDLKAVLAEREFKKEEALQGLRAIETNLLPFAEKIYEAKYIDIKLEDIEYDVIVYRDDNSEEFWLKTQSVFDADKAENKYRQSVRNKIPVNFRAISDYFFNTAFTPNLSYDEKITNEAVQRAVENIVRTKTIVNKGSLIVAEGEVIDEEKSMILSRYFNIRAVNREGDSTIWDNIGTVGHGLILLMLIVLYMGVLRKDIWKDNFKIFLILLFSVLTVLAAWSTQRVSMIFPPEYLIILPGFTLVIAILVDVRAAVIIALINALMIAGIRNNDYIIGTTYLIASGITAYSIRRFKNIAQTFSSIIVILIGFSIPIAFFGFETHADNDFILRRMAVASINAILSPVFAFLILTFLDRMGFLWHFETNLDLKKYDNKDHYLIRMLREKAPGTYQHTLSVANLAETCAAEIGADAELVRIGAYYHDIGKAVKSEYFTENQNARVGNKHDKISPKQSVLIIKGHVLKGMEIAREHNLPKKIEQFIPMHHGTSLIKHFYAKALEESDKVDDSFFRYAGPKPQNKESAILMICDVSEAISRIGNATLEEIEDKIDSNIQEKVADGQLNESGITLGDLERIKQVIAEVIHGMIHQRTSYNNMPEPKKKG